MLLETKQKYVVSTFSFVALLKMLGTPFENLKTSPGKKLPPEFVLLLCANNIHVSSQNKKIKKIV